MKAVILAGGLGTRISEETYLKPKPMITIGNYPMLWHIMKIYSKYNINEFIICCGYKGYMIKEYFANYVLHNNNLSIDIGNNKITVHSENFEKWIITLIDTGEFTMTGGRIKRIQDYIQDDRFCLTYGDGVSDINISELIKFHMDNGKLCTISAFQPTGRFGALDIDGNNVKGFIEKPKGDGGWINVGFFVVETKAIEYIKNDKTLWEKEPLTNLASDNQLAAYKHYGFWYCMDTLRDRNHLEELWADKNCPWKIW